MLRHLLNHKSIALLAILFAVLNTFQVVYKLSNGFVNVTRSPQRKPGAKFDDSISGLAWFVQVSDLHFSIFIDENRSKDFLHLCKFIKQSIQPKAVVLTGDLTDAKTIDKLGSRQFEAEWKIYRETMQKCGAFDKNSDQIWLDIRGNHDTFNTNSHENDFFSRYGIRNTKNDRMYTEIVEANNISVGFVGMDASLAPGPKRPFNFFGSLSQNELEEFQMIMHRTKKSSDYQIVFGHYPTSTVLSPTPGIKSIIGQSSSTLAYLCGHLHTLNGLAPHMYSTQPEGFLEIELGDWKDNRVFRLMAVDQGEMIFHDTIFDKNTTINVALILNPIDMTYVQPSDAQLIKESTHLRVLVFSEHAVSQVQAQIDDREFISLSQSMPDAPLYTAPWSPSDFNDGKTHVIKVVLNQTIVIAESKFSLSPSMSSDLGITGVFAKIVLYFNWSLATQAVFGLCAASIVIPLCVLKIRPRSHSKWRLIKGLSRIAATDKLFHPLILISVYIAICPWAIGYFLDENLGLLFPWGLFIDGHVLPADVTHLYGIVFMYSYIHILIFALALKRRKKPDEANWLYFIKSNFLFMVVMLLQVLHCVEFYLCYGVLATLIGTCGIGRLIFVYYLWTQSIKF